MINLLGQLNLPRSLVPRTSELTAIACLAMCLQVCLVSGCGRVTTTEQFGALHRPASVADLNGLGIHQRLWENAGAKCVMPTKLSPLLEEFDAIVLVGTSHDPPAREARNWLEDWLSRSEGRSVIYFGYDFDGELFYRESTVARVADQQRNRAADLRALREAEVFAERTENIDGTVFCRWFMRSERKARKHHSQFQGPWSDVLADARSVWPVAITLEPPTDELRDRTRAAMIAKFKSATTNSSIANAAEKPDSVYRSYWSEDDVGSAEVLDEEWELAPESEILLAGTDRTPLVTRLTSSRFENSQILIVANGAPLLNGSLVDPAMLRLSARIVQQCAPAERVAFLAFGQQGILISEVQEKDPRVAGLELLTVWPLNVMVMHAALLGIIACIVLLPVLGRPQTAPQRCLSDFGQHVEAMGYLLSRTGDSGYAQRMIAEYFRLVRKENAPNWIEVQTVISPAKMSNSLDPKAPPSSTIPSVASGPAEPPRVRNG